MNVDDMLLPVTENAPCGPDLSFSVEFDLIQELRREDDASLAQGAWVRANKIADWPGVISACATLLTNRTKDLRLAGWWAEARTRVDGFTGLDHGLALMTRLVTDYWDGVHPAVEEGDAEPRIGSLQWLLFHLPTFVNVAPLVPALHGKPVTLLEVDAARLREQAVTRGTLDAATLQANGELLIAGIQRHAARQPAGSLSGQLAALSSAQAHLAQLQQVLDERLGADSPSFDAAGKALDAAFDAVQRLGRDSGVLPAVEAVGGGTSGQNEVAATAAAADAASARAGHAGSMGTQRATPSAPSGATASASGGQPQTRAQALHQLRDVAAFFRRTEPHSPVAYLADKAARWGDMPLHDWLRAVVKDGSSLAQLEDMLGVEPPVPPDGA